MRRHRLIHSALILSGLLGASLLSCSAAFAQVNIVASPAGLNLDNTTGSDVIRTVTLTTTSTTPINFTTFAQPTSWLTVSPISGSVVAGSPVLLTLEANAAQLSVGNDYNINVPINVGGQPVLQIPVYFNIEMVTGLTVSPASVGWQYAIGGASPVQQPITLTTSASTFSAQVSAGTSWFALTVPNGGPLFSPQAELESFPTSQGFIVVFNSSAQGSLTPGMSYSGTVTVTDSSGNTAIITVTLVVLNTSSAFTLSQQSVTLQSNGAVASTTLQLFATNPTAFNAVATVNNPPNGTWLSATSTGTAPEIITINANPAGLPANTYQGSVTFVAGTLSAVLQVTFVVTVQASSGGNVVSSSPSLSFGYVVGTSAPQTQTLNITDQVGNAAIPFTVSASVPSGQPAWLSAQVTGGGTQGTTGSASAAVIVTANPQGLAPGSYTGAFINITPVGGNVVGIPVTFQVTGQSTVSASPLQLSFSYQLGNPAPSNMQIQVVGTAPSLGFNVVTATQLGGNWLSVNPTSGATSATTGTATVLNVSIAPGQLGVGSYQGSITVGATGNASGTTTIQVFLTVTVLLPSITSVVNAASFLGSPVSPGEIVSIFGTNLGPTPAVGTTLTAAGTVSTNIGNVQVLFNGTPAPLTYVSATQINCVVPYEFAQVNNSPYVQVKNGTQTSNVFNLQQAASNPAIFTVAAGTGQGAILNGNNSVNSQSIPAAPGSTVQVYLTGEGLLNVNPQPVDGTVTCSAGCASLSQIPAPQLKVAVLINNQPATVTFAGESPSLVSGVLQVDVTIPPNTPAGPIPITVMVGSASSQSGVTVYVQ